ncbi:MAG: hypothetical protein VX527_10920 [Planctomycetota bacterium]|nr:hypothetical protein [Planctomycetota bacterium]
MPARRPQISNFLGIRRFRRSHYRTNLFRLDGLCRGYRITIVALIAVIGLCGTSAQADLDLENCVGGWLEARTWVNDMAIPGTPTEASYISEASAVCIILRHRGRTVGYGLTHTEEVGDRGQTLMQAAAAQAIETASKDDIISGLPESIRREAGKQLTLEMEIAGPLEALMGRTFMAATERLRPGIDGMAMRHNDRWWFQFPSQLRLTNASVGPERLYSLALASELSPRQIETLRDQGDVSLYRFTTIDLAQATPSSPPLMLTSGDMEVVESEVTSDGLEMARDNLARHVLSRIFKTDDGYRLVGSFTPLTSSFEQKSPMQRDRYLTALALAQFATTPGVDPELAKQARTAAVGLLETTPPGEASPSGEGPVEAATWCLAADRLGLEDQNEYVQTTRSFLHEIAKADDSEVRKHAHDVIVVAAALSTSSPEDRALSITTARRARDVLPSHQHVTLLPWLGWIERSNRSNSSGVESESDLASLKLIRDHILDLQVRAMGNAGNTLDAGGFRLKPGTRGVTSQSLRPAVFLIETMNDPAYADVDRREEIQQSQRRFLRYLLQLTCRDDVAGSWRQPDRIRGGIRHATWDARMEAVAQAMGLIALCNATQ